MTSCRDAGRSVTARQCCLRWRRRLVSGPGGEQSKW
jgi:hypothetical protein